MTTPEFTTAQTIAAFNMELASYGLTEAQRTPLLVEALRHEMPSEGLRIDGTFIPQSPAE